jgi:uncharacterized membrane protein
MITHPLVYLFIMTLIVITFISLEKRFKKAFKYLPAIVMIYAVTMFLSYLGLFEHNSEIHDIYSRTKSNLLPAMLFLLLLQVSIKEFLLLGKNMLLAYFSALFSLVFAFITVFILFNFNGSDVGIFAALSGSWMGGTANMLAIASAFNVSEANLGIAIVTDSINYTIWVAFLLAIYPLATFFNRFTKATLNEETLHTLGCACTIGAKRYWPLLFISIMIALASQLLAPYLNIISLTTSTILMATLFGLLGSFTPLSKINGSSEIGATMLYFLIALIGSQTQIESLDNLGIYILAGFTILLLHAFIMIVLAKLFKLDLFSVAIASLANIGGVASAPILAATYHKSLVGVAILMAIMGYLIGTFSGLAVGNILKFLS